MDKRTTVLTQGAGALRLGALVLGEVEPQRAVPQGVGDLPQIVHQIPTQRVVQQGIPQRGRRAEVVPRHHGSKTKGRKRPLAQHADEGKGRETAEVNLKTTGPQHLPPVNTADMFR